MNDHCERSGGINEGERGEGRREKRLKNAQAIKKS